MSRPPYKPTALSGALVAVAGVLQLLYMLTANRWLVLGAAAVAGLALTGHLMRPDLSAVRICIGGARRSRAGEPVRLELHVHNDGRRVLPPTRFTLALAGVAGELLVDVDAVHPSDVAPARLTPTTLVRGVYRGSVVSCSLTDPFGLVRTRRTWQDDRELLVVPAAAEATTPVLSSVRTTARARASVTGTEELAGLRPWRTGEDRRAVHWRASARRGRLVVVERDVPDLPTRWVLVLVGTPAGPADEAALATAAATWADQVRRGHDVNALAWRADGTRYEEPDAAPQGVEDWFARIATLAVPSGALVLESLPENTDALTVVASESTPAGWLDELTHHAARQGVRVSVGLVPVGRVPVQR
ncbi:DUF58 domain-containing protein [Angustibacter sp. McL0619]|uniref:DUF58 domain-containing protein n=1 Tax=Angustibacter sp. McL0619 TaxID=3415676 RepID=UPI003CF4611A